MKLKNLSKILAFGILLNSIPINSFAGILSEDTRYKTFRGNSIKIDEVLEEDEVDVEVEGNTLVNLHGKQKYGFAVQSGDAGKYIKTEEINYVSATIMEDLSSWYFLSFGKLNLDLIKPNTTYTIYFEKSKGVDFVRFCCKDSNGNIASVYKVPVVNNKAVITTTNFSLESINDDVLLYGLCNRSAGTEIEVSNAMIFEGNLEHENLDYFEGIKSVGELEGNKLNIVSQNKNLIEKKDVVVGGLTDDGLDNDNTSYWKLNKFIKIKGSTQYILSIDGESTGRIFYYDSDYNFISSHLSTENAKSPLNAKYLRFRFHNVSHKNLEESTIQIEEGLTATSYISHKSNKKEILLSEPLRGLPNGTKDRIIKRNGQWVVERNIEEIILNGSEDWYIDTDRNSNSTNYFRTSDFMENRAFDNMYNHKVDFYLNDTYKQNSASNNWHLVDSERISLDVNNYKSISIREEKLTLDEFKNKLKNNPVTIVCQLVNPYYESLSMNSVLSLYEDTTHISNNSNIPATMKVTVDRTLNRATEAIELAKVNPTIANLSRARYWTNLLKESTKKDELQEEINNNVDVVDLQLERKIASANLDLYIKCENMLSMSLDTNQISFDNFSGVEDLEKQNAIAISVNSSLPYQLNSYLVSEIQNSDKSKIMDKDILNIRENSDGEYKTFNDINEKLVLKDNIAQGNDNVHNIDLMLKSGLAFDKDIYKATIKLEAEQK